MLKTRLINKVWFLSPKILFLFLQKKYHIKYLKYIELLIIKKKSFSNIKKIHYIPFGIVLFKLYKIKYVPYHTILYFSKSGGILNGA